MAEKKKKGLKVNKAIGEAIAKCYQDAQTKRPLAWSLLAGGNPLIEIAHAAGIQLVFPENYGAACSTKHASGRYCEIAEAHDYSSDLCSYCRNCFGYIFAQDAEPPQGGMPEPDLFLMTTNACVHYIKWFDSLRLMYNKPLVMVNTPRVMDKGRVEDYYLEHTVREIEGAIAEIERITNIKVTHEKLSEAVKLSDELNDYWREIIEMQKAVPAPMNLPDIGNVLFPVVGLRGTREGVELMKQTYTEVKQCVAEKRGAIEEEKHRLMFLNIPLWYNLRLAGYFAEKGACFPFMDYAFYVWPPVKMDPSRPIESLAAKALYGQLNEGPDAQIDNLIRDIKEFHIDGVVIHSDRSCKVMSLGLLDAARIIRETYHIPVLVFDLDHTDERVYSDAEFKNRVDAFLEMLE